MPAPEAAVPAVRSFVALPCPEALRRALAAALARWRKLPVDVRWTAPARVHLTLRFLGDAARSPLDAMNAGLARLAREAAPLVARPGRIGAFPDWRRPRVLWLGLKDDGRTARLAEAIERQARAAGFAPEARAFTPHLTIGRVASPRGVAALAEALRGWTADTPAETMDAIILYRSELAPAGPRYTALARHPLTGVLPA